MYDEIKTSYRSFVVVLTHIKVVLFKMNKSKHNSRLYVYYVLSTEIKHLLVKDTVLQMNLILKLTFKC